MGAIHGRAVLFEDELQPARDIGLPVLDDAERPLFALPCPKLAGTSCTIFGNRPRVCGSYRCQVLIDLQEGRLSFDEASHLVQQALDLVESVRALLPADMDLPDTRTLTGSVRHGSEAAVPPALRLHATMMHFHLDKHFRKAKEGRTLEMVVVTSTDCVEGQA